MYDYYCVDCGKKLGGEEICFNLADMLGLEGIKPGLALVSYARLNELAGKDIDLYQRKRQRIAVTLKSFLKILGKNLSKEQLGGSMSAEVVKRETERIEREMELLKYSELELAMQKLIPSTAADKERQELTKKYVRDLEAHFTRQFLEEDEENEDRYEDTENYAAYLWIEPLFFEEEDARIYSLKYSAEVDPINLEELLAPQRIRGYCPCCGAPVLEGAGKYPHRLIGLLGAQSAGKTSIIISMLDEMQNNFDEYGMEYPDRYLCDSRFYTIDWNLRLFQKGWAVMKTPVKAGKNTFNASILLCSSEDAKREHAQIVTFIDIAGEMCYDWRQRAWNPDALKEFPLISHCDLYLLCTCIDEDAYGEIDDDGKGQRIGGDAVLKIAKGIYGKLPSPPPLCIVATKADLTGDPAGENRETPFEKILNMNPEFFHKGEVEKMRNFYNTCPQESVRRPLKWCMRTYDEMERMTYLSMMSCSALGGTRGQYQLSTSEKEELARQSQGQEDENQLLFRREIERNETIYGDPMGLDALWNWILMVLGFKNISVGGGINEELLPENPSYRVSDIPNYGDFYRTANRKESEHRMVFDISEAMDRVQAVKKLFINSSPHDQAIYEEYVGLEDRFFRKATPERRMQAVIKCADSWQ